MTETPEQRDARIRSNIAKMKSGAHPASDDEVETYLREVEHLGEPAAPPAARAPTGHAGKPFVDAPEMLQQHKGTPFVDAEPEPSYLSKAAGGVAALGRYVDDDTQTAVRAMTREHGISDLVKALGHTSMDDVAHAARFGPLGYGSLVTDKLEATPSYTRAKADIHHAEDTAGNIGTFNKGWGALLGFAPGAGPVTGAVKGGLAPLGAKLSNGLPGKMVKGAFRGLVGAETAAPVAGSVRPAQGLQGPMADVAEAATGQNPLESGAAIARPVATARPPIGDTPAPAPGLQSPIESATDATPDHSFAAIGRPVTTAHPPIGAAPSSVTEVQSPMESAADLTRNHPIAADVVKTADAVNAPAAAPDVAAKVGRQSHRTKASFQDIAKRVSDQPAPHVNPLSIREKILAGIALTPTP